MKIFHLVVDSLFLVLFSRLSSTVLVQDGFTISAVTKKLMSLESNSFWREFLEEVLAFICLIGHWFVSLNIMDVWMFANLGSQTFQYYIKWWWRKAYSWAPSGRMLSIHIIRKNLTTLLRTKYSFFWKGILKRFPLFPNIISFKLGKSTTFCENSLKSTWTVFMSWEIWKLWWLLQQRI